MELKPGHKQTEAGVIPEDWDGRPLGSIGKPVRGGSPRPAGDPKYFNGTFIPWLTVAAMTNIPSSQLTVTETETFLTEEGSQLSRMLNPETLIIANSGATLGVAKILGIKCCANDGIAALLNIKPNISPHFLAHLINAKTHYLREVVATGNGQPNLNTKLIGDFTVPLPPTRAEQDAVSDVLSDADLLIQSLEQLLVKKRQIKQGAMQELLTGKKRLPGFKAKWPEKALGDLFHFSGGLSASRDQLGSEGLSYLHYGDIHASSKTFVDVRTDGVDIPKLEIRVGMVSPKSLLSDGDVVFVDASEDDEGTSRHVVIFNEDGTPFISGLHTIVAKNKTGELNREYKRYCFQTRAVKSQFKFYAVGTKVSGISKTNIAKVNIPVPEVAEQAAIAIILVAIDAEITALDAKLAKARQLKQGMIQELLTGRIRLVRPSAQILSFPAKESASATNISHNTHFNEAVVIAVLSAKFGSDKFPFGRFRRTKFSYLLHRHVEHEAAGFMKKAAGPYNPRTRYGGAEKIALQNRYVRVLSTGKSEGFVAAENIAQAEGYFDKWYGAEALTWLEQFRYQKNDALELLTTVDMACEDLSRAGKSATLSAVKQIIHDSPEWEAKLNRAVFSDDNIATTIQSCGQLFPIHEE